jgi:hypothetical protein
MQGKAKHCNFDKKENEYEAHHSDGHAHDPDTGGMSHRGAAGQTDKERQRMEINDTRHYANPTTRSCARCSRQSSMP